MSATKNVINISKIIRENTKKRVSPAFRDMMHEFLTDCLEDQLRACESAANLKNQKTLLDSHWIQRDLETPNLLS